MILENIIKDLVIASLKKLKLCPVSVKVEVKHKAGSYRYIEISVITDSKSTKSVG